MSGSNSWADLQKAYDEYKAELEQNQESYSIKTGVEKAQKWEMRQSIYEDGYDSGYIDGYDDGYKAGFDRKPRMIPIKIVRVSEVSHETD